jgi:hypothetical protein
MKYIKIHTQKSTVIQCLQAFSEVYGFHTDDVVLNY